MINYELKIGVVLNQNINMNMLNFEISNLINSSMLNNVHLTLIHSKNQFKPYCFSSLLPLEKETKIYENNKFYYFYLRSYNLDFILKLKNSLSIAKTNVMYVTDLQFYNYEHKKITEITSLTPAISTITNQETKKIDYWKKDDGIEIIKNRINSNALMKYKYFINKNIDEPKNGFIAEIYQLNNKHISIQYKNSTLKGNKFSIKVKEDEESQKLAQIILSCGMLEKNALGFGFCSNKD